ncbi:MAG: hypothetical protein HOV83_29230 [Catenulispora sp.]|nr:hypothetical protein [Catenulispora sp.]
MSKAAAQKGQVLEKGTLSPMLSKGRCSDDKLILFLDVCQVPRKQWQAWRDTLERVSAEHPPGIPGAVRVGAVNADNLHIHRAIEVDGLKGRLPAYVERDTDTAPGGVRELLRQVKDGGGMVVVVGESSVGKTRCAFEAIRAVMPGWWMIIPADGDHLRELARQPLARTVIWLDELQDYLDGERGLNAGMVRAFKACGAVLVATLWPTYYTAYTALPLPDRADPYRVERQVLELAQPPVAIEPSLSREELKRARQIAQDDRRIQVALDVTGYSMTQALAGVPQLIDRWKHAGTYAKAILCAAVDATRLGVRAPLSPDLLREAAPGYCTPRQRAEARHTPN